jgi:hypothetical protein
VARVVPALEEDELRLIRSKAEARFYTTCRDRLPADWVVLFSVPWVCTSFGGAPRDGEADFVILVPDVGMLIVEVKGGGVEFDPPSARWTSIDRNGARHQIKDPFSQARNEKHAIIRLLKDDAQWRAKQSDKILIGHAVLLADVACVDGLVGTSSPREIIGGSADVAGCEKWVLRALEYWRGQSLDATFSPLTVKGIGAIESVLFRRLEARPLLANRLAADELLRIALTEQQSRVLRALGSRSHAAICGGAGTGKTLLAVERARMCARRGMKTLLLTYNRLLADYMKHAALDEAGLLAMSFHQLCEWRSNLARRESGRDLEREAELAFPSRGGSEYYDLQLPFALALSTEILTERFDAIIVDEAQDFRAEYWAGVELLHSPGPNHCFYVFYDPNQAIYTQSPYSPIREQPFLLTSNCRNTRAIHDFAYRYFKGDATDPPIEIVGEPVEFKEAASITSQATTIHSLIVNLLSKEGILPSQVAVLVCGQPKSSYFDAICQKPLPRGASWSIEGPAASNGVRLDTVRRFKGLEADIVFLWGVDSMPADQMTETLYIGSSRAKSKLCVVGNKVSISTMQSKNLDR